MYNNKRICILGGSGSFGQTYIQYLLNETDCLEIVAVGKSENNLVQLKRAFPDNRLIIKIGDIKEPAFLDQILKNINIVIHAAALKHVDFCEDNIIEAINTNINGTINVLIAAVKCQVEHVINLSSDKAVNPSGVYGASKLFAEKLFIHFQQSCENNKIKFDSIRYNNIVDSSGSVGLLFKERLQKDLVVKVFDPNMFRRFLTQNELIQYINLILDQSIGGQIFVPLSPCIKIKDLAEVMCNSIGSGRVEVEEDQLREGERLGAKLLSDEETKKCLVWNDRLLVICQKEEYDLYLQKESFKKLDNASQKLAFSGELYNDEQIRNFISEGGLI